MVLESGELPKIATHFKAPYEFVYNVINKSHKPLNILEVGSGTGLHLIELAKNGHSCIGVDISELSIKSATQMAESLGCKDKIEFLVGSFDNPSIKTKKLDVIFTSGTLYYLNIQEFIKFLKSSFGSSVDSSIYEGVEKDLDFKGFICVETNGSNYILNLYRWVRHKLTGYRDETTLSKLLTKDMLKPFFVEFQKVELTYFDFLTLSCARLPEGSPLKNLLLKLFRRLDNFILNQIGLNFLAFKFVMQVRGGVRK